jgi:anti-sigma B factor antagonist
VYRLKILAYQLQNRIKPKKEQMMNLTIKPYESADVVHMPENLTVQNASAVAKEFANLINAGKNRLVLNMQDLNFADSSGLAVLVTAYKKALNNSGRIVLLSPQPNVSSLLQLTRIDALFEVFQEINEAVKSFS